MNLRYALFGLACLSSSLAVAAEEQGLDYIKAHYTKYEYRIPMRDGKRLFTCVYAPKDPAQKYPLLMSRTPYSCAPYGVDQYKSSLGPSALFAKEGYIFVYQDVRGRWMSEGEHVNMRPHLAEKKSPSDIDESSDTFDTIDWLLKHVPGHNGRVGTYGISYPGFYTSAGMIDAHPALKAASPQAPICDWFVGDDWHHNGALQLTHAFNFIVKFGQPRPEPIKKTTFQFDHGTPDGYDFFLDMGTLKQANVLHMKDNVAYWKELFEHGTYDEYWQARNLRPHLKNIRPAVMTVGGWFDAENLFGALETYRSVERQSPGTTNTLVMGPWLHGGWSRSDGDHLGDVRFNSKTSEFYRESIELAFFEHHLKDKGAALPEAWIFETGTNQWRQYDAWPPRTSQAKNLFLVSGGSLAWQAPNAPDDTYDDYVSDPAHPVPYYDKITTAMAPEFELADQRFAARRPDVLSYIGPELESDVTVAGPIDVELYVSTTGTDSDWVVKLIDVYPDDYPDPSPNPAGVRMGGYQQLVRGDVMRGKFRNSLTKPEPFEPGKPTLVRFTLEDACHSFRTGHRIMVQVQSSWFPLFDRNPQVFTDIYTADASLFHRATQRVYAGQNRASKLSLRVLP